jgi:hypothetical protein
MADVYWTPTVARLLGQTATGPAVTKMEQSPVVACFPVKSVMRILKVKVPGFPEI